MNREEYIVAKPINRPRPTLEAHASSPFKAEFTFSEPVVIPFTLKENAKERFQPGEHITQYYTHAYAALHNVVAWAFPDFVEGSDRKNPGNYGVNGRERSRELSYVSTREQRSCEAASKRTVKFQTPEGWCAIQDQESVALTDKAVVTGLELSTLVAMQLPLGVDAKYNMTSVGPLFIALAYDKPAGKLKDFQAQTGGYTSFDRNFIPWEDGRIAVAAISFPVSPTISSESLDAALSCHEDLFDFMVEHQQTLQEAAQYTRRANIAEQTIRRINYQVDEIRSEVSDAAKNLGISISGANIAKAQKDRLAAQAKKEYKQANDLIRPLREQFPSQIRQYLLS